MVENFNKQEVVVPNTNDIQAEIKEVHIPAIGIFNIPVSICEEIRIKADHYVKRKGWVCSGPTESGIWLCKNEKKASDPFTVRVDKKLKRITCEEKMCINFKLYRVCCHTIAVAAKCGYMGDYIAQLNKRNFKTTDVLAEIKEKGAGKKRNMATQVRKGPPNKKKPEVVELIDPPDEHPSQLSLPVTNPDTISPQSSDFFATPIVSNIQYSPSISQLSPGYQSLLNPFAPFQIKNAAPKPEAGRYILSLLGCCHANVSVCYGCGVKFREPSFPNPPNDLVIVSRTKRSYFNKASQQYLVSPNLTNVYFHFNTMCIRRHDPLFTPYAVQVPLEIRQYLLREHIETITSSGISLA